jgi:uncharacterized protein YkwD
MPCRRALAALSTVAALALAAPPGAGASAGSAACPSADAVPTAATLPAAGQATLCLLNDERAAAGLRPLVEAPALTRPSLAYSALMVSQGFFGHVAPSGATLIDRLTAAGYIPPSGEWLVGENLAWGQGDLATPRHIVDAWMKSPGHRDNILTGRFAEIGLGIVLGTPTDPSWGATYTTDFGAVAGRVVPLPAPPPAVAPPPAPVPAPAPPSAAPLAPGSCAASAPAAGAGCAPTTRAIRRIRRRAAPAPGRRSPRRPAGRRGGRGNARHGRARDAACAARRGCPRRRRRSPRTAPV